MDADNIDDVVDDLDHRDDDTAPMGVPSDDTSPFGDANPEGETPEEIAVEHDIEALLAERDQFKDIALRLQADFDNYRRRMATQQTDEIARATGKIASALLPVLDACEAAFVQHPAEVEPLFNLLLGELRKQGLEAMNLQDEVFDPSLADAVLTEPGDGGEPVVAEVLRTGYLWKGKVLRAAMVKVRS